MPLNLVNSISHELSILPPTLDPQKRFCRVETVVDCNLIMISAERLLYGGNEIHFHVSGNQFQSGIVKLRFAMRDSAQTSPRVLP